MKRTLNYLFAVLCIFAAASCAKEIQTQDGASDGPRVITCTFEAGNGTKTSLDGLSPKWQAGDEIALFACKYEDYTNVGPVKVTLAASDISADGSSFRLTIPSEWGLTENDFIQAIYPYSVAISVEGRERVNYLVPDQQDGTFASANICADASPVYEGKLEFVNLTTVIKMVVDPSVTKKVVLKNGSGGKLNGQSRSDLMTFPIGCYTPSGAPTTVVTVSSPEVYISVSPSIGLLSMGSSLAFYSDDDLEQLDTEVVFQSSTQLGTGKLFDLGLMPRKYLNGVYSVSERSKVNFSCGNLYYDADISRFGIETRQDAFAADRSDSHISHFFWSKDQDVAVAKDYADDETSVVDIIFTNSIGGVTFPNAAFSVEGLTGIWRVLTSSEWDYLLSSRKMTNDWRRYDNYCKEGVTLSGSTEKIYGLFIYPDDYKGPEVSDMDWKDISSKGIVFLPASSYRVGDHIFEKDDFHMGSYWCSDCSSYRTSNAFSVYFSGDAMNPSNSLDRSNSVAIRLVKDVE